MHTRTTERKLIIQACALLCAVCGRKERELYIKEVTTHCMFVRMRTLNRRLKLSLRPLSARWLVWSLTTVLCFESDVSQGATTCGIEWSRWHTDAGKLEMGSVKDVSVANVHIQNIDCVRNTILDSTNTWDYRWLLQKPSIRLCSVVLWSLYAAECQYCWPLKGNAWCSTQFISHFLHHSLQQNCLSAFLWQCPLEQLRTGLQQQRAWLHMPSPTSSSKAPARAKAYISYTFIHKRLDIILFPCSFAQPVLGHLVAPGSSAVITLNTLDTLDSSGGRTLFF